MRRLWVLLLAILVLAACTKPAPPTAPTPEPKATPSEPAQVYNPGGGAPAPKPGALEDDIPKPGSMPEGMRRAELAAGQSISEPGVYFMDLASGKLEAWLMPPWDGYKAMRWMTSTQDHRWLLFTQEGTGYLIRRSDAKVFRYDPERISVTPGPDLFLLRPRLWQPGTSSRFALVDREMQLLSTFTLDPSAPDSLEVLFSPDGKLLAVAERSTPGGGLSLVDVASGRVTKLRDSWGDGSVSFLPLPALGEFVVTHGDYEKPLTLERYTWQGKLVGRKQVGGWHATIAADGRSLAYYQSMGAYGQAAVMQDWAEEKPLLRVAGSGGVSWLANGKELVVETSRGWQFVSRSGAMQPVPQGGEPGWPLFQWYLPSPDKPELFLTGTRVIDRSGRTVQATQVAEGAQAKAQGGGWGPGSREVQIQVVPPLGKGFELADWVHFLPRVQRPPFPETYPLQVLVPAGECLNLRQEPSRKGPVLRCLPASTRLAITEVPGRHGSGHWAEEITWMFVETERGEKGWVAISQGNITYAD